MKRPRTLIAMAAGCAAGLGVVTLSHAASTEQQEQCPNIEILGDPPVYFPYPTGLIPVDLCSEVKRVQREVDVIFKEALAEWRALPPPTLNGQPPVLQGTGSQAVVLLGKLLNYDRNMSVGRDVACGSCHMPYTGFTAPIPSINLGPVAMPGSMHFRWGKRKPQSYTYSPYFPGLQYNRVLKVFLGGNFWDSRSTGYKLSSPDAEQAQHPPVDPNEHGFPDTACIAYRLSHAEYRPLFELVWGEGSFDITWPADTEAICSTPEGAAVLNGSRNALHQHLTGSSGIPASDAGAMPVALSRDDRTKADNVFDHWGQALEAFEASANVSAFSSKFDAFLAGTYTLTADEQAGYNLFRGKGNCNSCHLDGRGTALKSGQTDTSAVPGGAPLFTCFGSANEGLPRNPNIPFYYETKPDAFDYTPNPAGFGFKDFGLGLFLRSLSGNNPNADWIQYAPSVDGQMQVSSARNAAMTPPNCPNFQKAFFHNGYVKSLKELVHFYNTRDVFAYPVQSGHCPPGTIEKVTCWPEPEVKNNIDMTIGNLGLSDHEEDLIVIFLGTLTDGFTTPYPDADKYTGNCLPPTALSPPPPPVSAAPVPPGLTPPSH